MLVINSSTEKFIVIFRELFSHWKLSLSRVQGNESTSIIIFVFSEHIKHAINNFRRDMWNKKCLMYNILKANGNIANVYTLSAFRHIRNSNLRTTLEGAQALFLFRFHAHLFYKPHMFRMHFEYIIWLRAF